MTPITLEESFLTLLSHLEFETFGGVADVGAVVFGVGEQHAAGAQMDTGPNLDLLDYD